MGTTVNDLIAGGIEIMTVDGQSVGVLAVAGSEVDLVAVAGGAGMGSSFYFLHKDYLCIYGGNAGSNFSTMPPFNGGTAATEFSVTQRFRNRMV